MKRVFNKYVPVLLIVLCVSGTLFADGSGEQAEVKDPAAGPVEKSLQGQRKNEGEEPGYLDLF